MNFNKHGRTAQLFDYQTMSEGLVGGILNSNGTITTNVASSYWVITKYIPVAGREFTLQRQASGGATSICLYDSNQAYITGLAYNGNGTVTVSANTDVSYIRFTYYRTENAGNIMLNEGSTALPYEPYGNTWHNIPHYIHKTDTDTITTPAVLYPNDTTATVGLKGNMSQSGTPTSSDPIQPQECGERTGNLFDYVAYFDSTFTAYNEFFNYATIQLKPNTTYTLSTSIIEQGSNPRNTAFIVATTNQTPTTASDGLSNVSPITITTESDGVLKLYKRISGRGVIPTKAVFDNGDWIMLNSGSTALPYEPYGYKIPISSANTITPVYLGEVQTTRKIKKLVFDGTEGWQTYGSVSNTYRLSISNTQSIGNPAICSHFVNSPISSITSGKFTVGSTWIYIRYADVADVTDFKAYLAQQYANGTPVTVWYVLATPTTGIVNEPIRKIGDYADEVSGISIPTIVGANTLSIGTTLQPSEVTATYKGWHPVADVHEAENGQWD